MTATDTPAADNLAETSEDTLAEDTLADATNPDTQAAQPAAKAKTRKAATPKKAAASDPEVPAKTDSVVFVSCSPEHYGFEVMGLIGHKGEDGHVRWKMSAADAENFERHWHVVSGRIAREA